MGELAIVKESFPVPGKKVEIQVVKMENKPALGVALENPKLRDFTIEERNTATGVLISWLLDLLGVNDNGKNDHYNVLHAHINEAYLSYTYQEMKLAFEKYVKGEYKQNGNAMLVTQQINSVIFGRVMREYTLLKSQELDAYYSQRSKLPEPDISHDEKDKIVFTGTVECYDYFIQNRRIDWGHAWVYDYLIDELKLREFDNKEKSEDWKNAKELTRNRAKNSKDKNYRNELLKSIEEKQGESISTYKRLLMKRYFKEIEKEGKHIKDFI